MAGWIKLEKDLETDPRVLRMAKALERRYTVLDTDADLPENTNDAICNAHAFHGVTLVVGALTRLWIYADSHARDDDSLDLGGREIDEWLNIPGFCALMPSDWLVEIDDNTVELPGFHEHNGVDAKKRALTQKRVAQHRDSKQRPSVTTRNASALPDQDQTKTRPDSTATAPKARKKATKLPFPDDFVLTPELEQYAIERLPGVVPAELFEQFRGKALAKGWTYANWTQALQEFIRNVRPNSGHWAAGQYPRTSEGGVQWQ